MEMTIEGQLKQGKEDIKKSLEHLASELTKIRAGKANPSMLNGIMVEYYGNPTPLSQVANLGTPDSRTISIQPWEKSLLGPIEQAIFAANLGITPMNDGEFIRITIPPLTEDRRKDLVKQAKGLGEDTKVSLRTIRNRMMDFVKKEVKDGFPEDAGKRTEGEIEDMIKTYTEEIHQMIDGKEKDILKV